MPSESGVNIAGITKHCDQHSSLITSTFSGSWRSNIVDTLKLTHSVKKYLHQLQKIYYSKLKASQALCDSYWPALQQKDPSNVVIDVASLTSNLNCSISIENDSELICFNPKNSYFSKLPSLLSQSDSSHQIMTFLRKDNLECPEMNEVSCIINRTVNRAVHEGSIAFKLHSPIKNFTGVTFDSVLRDNRQNYSRYPAITMINGFPYCRVPTKYCYVDFMHTCWLSKSVSHSISVQANVASLASEAQSTVVESAPDVDSFMTSQDLEPVKDRASQLLEKSTSMMQSRLSPKSPIDKNHMTLETSTNLKDANNRKIIDSGSLCEPELKNDPEKISPCAYDNPDKSVVVCDKDVTDDRDSDDDITNVSVGNDDVSYESESENDVADDGEGEYSEGEDSCVNVIGRVANDRGSDSSDDLVCDCAYNFDDKAVQFDSSRLLNNSSAPPVNTSACNDIPGSSDKPVRSLFVCPVDLDSDEDESSDDNDVDDDDDDDDDEDDWNNPCITSSCGFDLDNESSCISGLFIASYSSDPVCASNSVSTGGKTCDNSKPNEENAPEVTEESRLLIEVNHRWNAFYTNEIYESSQLDASVGNTKLKAVRFTPDDVVYIEPLNAVEWAEDYAAARVGPWKTYAVDRVRFQQRVKELETRIGWVFNLAHRKNVYNLVQHTEEETPLIQCQPRIIEEQPLIESSINNTEEKLSHVEPLIQCQHTEEELTQIERRSSAVA